MKTWISLVGSPLIASSSLVVVYWLNEGLGRVLSGLFAGCIVALLFTILSWPLGNVNLHPYTQANVKAILHLAPSIALAALFSVMFEGSYRPIFDGWGIVIRGLMLGVLLVPGVYLDLALTTLTRRKRYLSLAPILVGSCALSYAVLSISKINIILISIIIFRLFLSLFIHNNNIILTNRLFTLSGAFVISSIVFILPLALFMVSSPPS